jgi:hypothetical protein
VKPAPLTRLSMMELASFIAAAEGTAPFFSVTAFSVTVEPLDKSRPRPTLKSLCQSPGDVMFLPTIPASIAITMMSSAARYRPGLDA